MAVPLGHRRLCVAQEFCEVEKRSPGHRQTARVGVPIRMPAIPFDAGSLHDRTKPVRPMPLFLVCCVRRQKNEFASVAFRLLLQFLDGGDRRIVQEDAPGTRLPCDAELLRDEIDGIVPGGELLAATHTGCQAQIEFGLAIGTTFSHGNLRLNPKCSEYARSGKGDSREAQIVAVPACYFINWRSCRDMIHRKRTRRLK